MQVIEMTKQSLLHNEIVNDNDMMGNNLTFEKINSIDH